MKGILTALFFGMNTLFWCFILYIFVLLKIIIPIPSIRHLCSRVMVGIAENWISGNSITLSLFHKIQWDIRGLNHVHPKNSYLVSANHQSWVDIIVLQHVFNRRIPFLRFFIKQSLAYVPILGGAWWALDFPMMKRYSKEFLEKHPEKRGEDLATTKRACDKFRGKHISVLNFLEGTRFTPEKHDKQKSPFTNLLKPKAGGVAFVLDSMGDQFHSLLDVTICYPKGRTDMWGLFSGRMNHVIVQVEEVKIPTEFLKGDYTQDPEYREKFQKWIHERWLHKDQLLTELHKKI